MFKLTLGSGNTDYDSLTSSPLNKRYNYNININHIIGIGKPTYCFGEREEIEPSMNYYTVLSLNH